MILAMALALTNPFPADVERSDCRDMVGYAWIREADGDSYQVVDPYPHLQAPHFFPDGALAGTNCAWFTEQLIGLDQRPLTAPSNQDILRVTWLRNFHNPVTISLSLAGHIEGELTWHRSDGAGGYEPGRVVEHDGRVLDPTTLARVKSRLDQAHPCVVEVDQIHEPDGSRWLFETLNADQYCLVSVASPGVDSPIGQLGLELLSLTELSIPADELY